MSQLSCCCFSNASESTTWQIIARAAPTPVAGVPTGPSIAGVPTPALAVGTSRTPCPDLRDKQGPRGMEHGLSQQEQLWGTESDIWGRKLELSWRGSIWLQVEGKGPWRWLTAVPSAIMVGGGDKQPQGQTEERGLRRSPPILSRRDRHQRTKIKEKLPRPYPPHQGLGIASLATSAPDLVAGAGFIGA